MLASSPACSSPTEPTRRPFSRSEEGSRRLRAEPGRAACRCSRLGRILSGGRAGKARGTRWSTTQSVSLGQAIPDRSWRTRRPTTAERTRLRELETENTKLRMERDLLKRSLAFWVRVVDTVSRYCCVNDQKAAGLPRSSRVSGSRSVNLSPLRWRQGTTQGP